MIRVYDHANAGHGPALRHAADESGIDLEPVAGVQGLKGASIAIGHFRDEAEWRRAFKLLAPDGALLRVSRAGFPNAHLPALSEPKFDLRLYPPAVQVSVENWRNLLKLLTSSTALRSLLDGNGFRELRRLLENPTSDSTASMTEALAWHTLTHAPDESSLRFLVSVGLAAAAHRYRQLFSLDPAMAKDFAAERLREATVLRSSRLKVHQPLLADSGAAMVHKRTIRCLLIDDDPAWGAMLQQHFQAFNATSQDYEVDLRYVGSPSEGQEALTTVKGLQAVVLDYFLEEGDFTEPESGGAASIRLAEDIRKFRPELALYGLTGQLPTEGPAGGWSAPSARWAVGRVFYKSDPAEVRQLYLAIIAGVRERTATPFFSALKSYSECPIAVFHALPLSHGKSVAGSQWARDFAEFYGEGYFAGETSCTMKPLDSMFEPSGSLRQARDRAAQAFGSDDTYFVTNGTTGANSIVYQGLLKPGDLVLLDRNCHRSHHYSVVQSGATVVYMEPEHVHRYGISSIVPCEDIVRTVKQYRNSVRLVALTHPTFDGVCYDVENVIRSVHAINPEVCFLFDEAWFAYGAFHPIFRQRSALAAARKLREQGISARVYVTQSIHKTLSAMRQGSAIHVFDHQFCSPATGGTRSAFEEAFKGHVTTSPNLHILASLDVARMQAEIEGFDLLGGALRIATLIRHELSAGPVRALTLKDLITQRLAESNEAWLDPLKVTLHFDRMPGSQFHEQELYDRFGIQTNKYSHNTVLTLVTIGTTWSMADHLVRSLKSWVPPAASTRPRVNGHIPPFTEFGAAFRGRAAGSGDLGRAYYRAMDPANAKASKLTSSVGKVSARFVTPYPPGFPILVPGQVVSKEFIEYVRFLRSVGVKHIHGLEADDTVAVMK